jgi:hypothetical protein
MALPTSAIPSKIAKLWVVTISTQTVSFDYPFQQKGAFAISLQMTGTIGTGATALQVSIDGTNFTTIAVSQSPVIGHTELAALTIALSPYSVNRNDLAYPFWNLKYTAGGGSSIAYTISVAER